MKKIIAVKTVWTIGAVFVAAMTIGAVLDFKNGININSVCSCIKMLLYLAAFTTGLIYLFKAGKDKFALTSACIYAVAAVFGFLTGVLDGSSYAPLDMLSMVVNVLVFILFPLTVAAFFKGRESKAFPLCEKFWWVPSAVSIAVALVESINTEINDSHGFDVSLIVLDLVVALILLLPMFSMTLTVKNQKKI